MAQIKTIDVVQNNEDNHEINSKNHKNNIEHILFDIMKEVSAFSYNIVKNLYMIIDIKPEEESPTKFKVSVIPFFLFNNVIYYSSTLKNAKIARKNSDGSINLLDFSEERISSLNTSLSNAITQRLLKYFHDNNILIPSNIKVRTIMESDGKQNVSLSYVHTVSTLSERVDKFIEEIITGINNVKYPYYKGLYHNNLEFATDDEWRDFLESRSLTVTDVNIEKY